MDAQSVRCQAEYHLKHNPSGGNIVLMFQGNSIFAKCDRGGCKRWTKLSISFPGVEVDFSKAAFSQKTMPKNFTLGNSIPPTPPPRIPVVVLGD